MWRNHSKSIALGSLLIVVWLFMVCGCLYAGEYQSVAHTNGSATVKADPKSGSVSTSAGSIILSALAGANEDGISDTDNQSDGPRQKSSLPTAMPTLGKGKYSSIGNVQAIATAGSTEGKGNARAAYSAGTLTWDTYGYAYANRGAITSSALGNAWIADPYLISWDDDCDFDLSLEFLIDAEESEMQANGNVGFSASSNIDLDNDGTFDQILWSLTYGYDAASMSTYVDFNLGDNCYFSDGLTTGQIEDAINAGWNGNVHKLTTDVGFTVIYNIIAQGPGSISVDLNCCNSADNAFENLVPEPTSILSLLAGLVGMGVYTIKKR